MATILHYVANNPVRIFANEFIFHIFTLISNNEKWTDCVRSYNTIYTIRIGKKIAHHNHNSIGKFINLVAINKEKANVLFTYFKIPADGAHPADELNIAKSNCHSEQVIWIDGPSNV